jgi:hypothetical protein
MNHDGKNLNGQNYNVQPHKLQNSNNISRHFSVPYDIFKHSLYRKGPHSSIGLATGRSGDRLPVAGGDFPRPSRPALAHPPIGTESFPGVKRSRGGVDHPALSNVEVKERVQI